MQISNDKGRQLISALVLALSASGAGFAVWKANEGFTAVPVIPTKGDVPTIGHGSTRYEDGTAVKITDPAITAKRAEQLALNLMKADAKKFEASMPANTKLTAGEFNVYMDFIGQYGIGNWNKSSMRTQLLAGNHVGACKSLLKYRYAAGYDCSTKVNGQPNKRCWGVWARQLERHAQCMEALQ